MTHFMDRFSKGDKVEILYESNRSDSTLSATGEITKITHSTLLIDDEDNDRWVKANETIDKVSSKTISEVPGLANVTELGELVSVRKAVWTPNRPDFLADEVIRYYKNERSGRELTVEESDNPALMDYTVWLWEDYKNREQSNHLEPVFDDFPGLLANTNSKEEALNAAKTQMEMMN